MTFTDNLAIYPSLRDRAVLITGGATGIGAVMVRAFVRQGAKVAFFDIDETAGKALAVELAGAPFPPVFVPCDVTNVERSRSAFAEAQEYVGTVDVLIANAANDRRHTLEEADEVLWQRLTDINIKSQFFAAQTVAPVMVQKSRGSIICFGSTGWMQKNAGYPIYATCKAAVHGLVNALARELGPSRIRVNALVPGWVMTDKQKALWLDAEGEAAIDRNQCISDRIQPEDVASLALFLAADDSRMCTGQKFVVDGGWT
ncbi:SDR family oxidoreductase [Gluconobacter sp. Dm-74]|uniref:SDR family NAD(P)-dependent oxidoreductase n=1 Tax=Gluconobacter sp. Dm-74 TaxID=2799803 RepID=UPI001B8C31D9|nr:SDR family oxidoreductase [Gluconobacter sp. Dm-74]MBS1092678.1 SDR family oxidoreductase [Gluconobacter sp. Dm-74]